MKPLHIHTCAQNHPDKQNPRYMSRIGGCSPALAAIISFNRWQISSLVKIILDTNVEANDVDIDHMAINLPLSDDRTEEGLKSLLATW